MHNLDVVFQPIFALSTNRPVGYEVLLRGHLPPEQLFAQATTVAEIHQLDRAARRLALQQFPFAQHFLFLNCHPLTILYDDELLSDLSRNTGCRYVLEITEQQVSEDLVARVRQLRAAGYLIALDDFGKAGSNFERLRQLDVDFVKLDKLFLQQFTDPKTRIFLTHLAELTQALRCGLIVEGVETAEQLQYLRQQGLAYAQGYYLGMPASSQFLRTNV